MLTGGRFVRDVIALTAGGSDEIRIEPGDQNPVFESTLTLDAGSTTTSESISVVNATVEGNLNLRQADGDGDIQVTQGTTVDGVTFVFGGTGTDTTLFDNVTLKNQANLVYVSGLNTIDFNNNQLEGVVSILGGTEVDDITFDNTTLHLDLSLIHI